MTIAVNYCQQKVKTQKMLSKVNIQEPYVATHHLVNIYQSTFVSICFELWEHFVVFILGRDFLKQCNDRAFCCPNFMQTTSDLGHFVILWCCSFSLLLGHNLHKMALSPQNGEQLSQSILENEPLVVAVGVCNNIPLSLIFTRTSFPI